MVVLILPAPQGLGEAYFVGAIRQSENACRVFCLERSHSPLPRVETTVLTEFAANGRMNWGNGSDPAVSDFVSLIERLISDPEARPNTFIDMRLA